MAAGGISDAWFSYRDQRTILSALLRAETTSAADKIESFLDGSSVSSTGRSDQDRVDHGHHGAVRLGALRAMRQTPGIVSISLLDSAGAERLHVSRIGLNRTEGGPDRSADPASGSLSAETGRPGHLSPGLRTVHDHGGGRGTQTAPSSPKST